MSEPIVVDMALAYKQMTENPNLTKMISAVLMESLVDDVAFDGYVRRSKTRYVDADKNPITPDTPWAHKTYMTGEWTPWSYQRGYSTYNPYVYQKGRCGKSSHEFSEILDEGTYAQPKWQWQGQGHDAWKTYQDEIKAWEATRKIVGYRETVVEVVEASIVVWK